MNISMFIYLMEANDRPDKFKKYMSLFLFIFFVCKLLLLGRAGNLSPGSTPFDPL